MANLKTIKNFKTRLAGGGARPNLFEVHIPSFPVAATESGADWVTEAQEDFRFLCKAAALPASNNGVIDVPFRGRILKVAGDRTFETWTITVINDVDFSIRSAFEKWMNVINRMTDATGLTDPNTYYKDAVVKQLDRNGGVLRSYKFWDIFPTNLSAMDLNYETTDTIQDFTVELQVHWWEAFRGTADQAGGEDIN